MNAWLVSNAFLTTSKYNEINTWLVKAAKKKDVDLELKTNEELMVQFGTYGRIGNRAQIAEQIENHEPFEISNPDKTSKKPDFVLFWDKDIRLAQYLEFQGLPLYNSARAIEICDDKSYTHLILEQSGIPMPKTFLAPKTFEAVGYPDLAFLSMVEEELGFPLVMKECFGSFGQQVYLIQTRKQLEEQVMKLAGKPLLFQKFLESSFGRDVRLQVVGGKVVASMYRYSDTGDFRANISNGGKMKPYEPSKKAIDLAIRCCECIGLNFAGVDLLFDEEEQPIVCEVNSNAHFKNIYDCTGVNAADYIIAHILEQQGKK